MDRFKVYLLNEDKKILGHRIGDVLTSVQDLQDDMDNLGTRHLSRLAEEIVNQIRKILHANWSPKCHKQLKELQRVAVAIQKTIDEKGDLRQILPAATQTLQMISGKMGVKVNDLQAPEEEIQPDDFQLTGNGPMPQQPNAMPPQPPTQG